VSPFGDERAGLIRQGPRSGRRDRCQSRETLS